MTLQFKNAHLDNPTLLSPVYCILVPKVMDSEELYNFLGSQLLPFLSDEIAPTDNVNIIEVHLTKKELDNLFSNGADRQIKEYNEVSLSNTVSNLMMPISAMSNTSYASSSSSSDSKPEATASNSLHPSYVVKAKSKGSRESSVSNVVKPLMLKAIKKFAHAVSNEDITKMMDSAIPQKMQIDNKYCYNLWNDWVSYRRSNTFIA